jgi:proline dehydrogenase
MDPKPGDEEMENGMQAVLRPAVLRVADHPAVVAFFRENEATRGLVSRFVAGESLDEALAASRAIAGRGMTTSLDLLGENVATETEARAVVPVYAQILRRMAADGLEPNISVKLTMLGLDLGDDLATACAREIVAVAAEVGGFVRIDMEGSAYTTRTLAIAETLHDAFPDSVGTVIQSYLYRSDEDVERLIRRNMRVRLVKGAYAEPAAVAYQRPREVDAAWARQMERLLDAGRYPALATQDPALILATKGYAARMGIPADRYEFQMLYGVRRDAQAELVAAGQRVRVYVPFGESWYPYFTRRIAERPANALFVLRQLLG